MAGVEDYGFEKKTLEEIREALEERAIDLFGEDIDLSKSSILRKLIDVQSLELAKLWDSSESIYSSAYVEEASGTSLDKIASLLGITRSAPTKSTGYVTFEGDEGTNVDSGFTVETDDETRFETIESGSIDTSETLELEVQSIDEGEYTNVKSGTITNFVDSKSGLITVTNENETTGGSDRENDKSLRTRIKTAVEVQGRGTKTAIKNRLLNLDELNIDSVTVDELPDRSLKIFIGGLTDLNQDDIDLIDETIDNTRAFGIPYEWSLPEEVNITVDDSDDGDITVLVTIDKDDYSDEISEIKGNIIDYVNSLGVNEDVIYNKIIDVIYNTDDWVYNIKDLYLNDSQDDISISDEKTAVTSESDINIDIEYVEN